MSEPTIVRDHTGEPVQCVICLAAFVEGEEWDARHDMATGPCHAPCCPRPGCNDDGTAA